MPHRSLRGALLEGFPEVHPSWALGWPHLVTHTLRWLSRALRDFWSLFLGPWRGAEARGSFPEPWETHPELRVYKGRGGDAKLLTVHTNPYSFQVDLAQLATKSTYFKALSRSRMQETAEGQLDLGHLPSGAFRSILEWVFQGHFALAEEGLLPAVQAASYLLVPGFLEQCWLMLHPLLGPENCLSYLCFAEAVGCPELQMQVCGYLSSHLLELAVPVTSHLSLQRREELAQLRVQGPAKLCVLRKENLTLSSNANLEALRGLYCRPVPPEEGAWHLATQLPFQADKWSFSTAQLLNYLFLVGGYRERRGARGFLFCMAAFRYNPLTGAWRPIASPSKCRRHFSTAVVGPHIYTVGGWYLDSLLAPDSSTCLHTAVERYEPWTDSWTLVSSLPMADFSFSISLSHDVPLCTAHAGSIYVLGNVQSTGEKLLLQYSVATDAWQELLPTLTRADADLPGLYFLGGTEPLYVVGGNRQDNVVTSFSLETHLWGPAHFLPKCSLAGQGVDLDGALYMSSPDLGAIMKVDLRRPDCCPLPPPPLPLFYEACFLLHFPLAHPRAKATDWRAAEEEKASGGP